MTKRDLECKVLVGACVLPALFALVNGANLTAVAAERNEPSISARGSNTSKRFLPLGIGRSYVVDLPRDAKDVLVANPLIADAVVRSARRAYLIGLAVGQTNVIFFDSDGRQIAAFDIAVRRDLHGVGITWSRPRTVKLAENGFLVFKSSTAEPAVRLPLRSTPSCLMTSRCTSAATDPATVLLGRFHRIYGKTASPKTNTYCGQFGFIID